MQRGRSRLVTEQNDHGLVLRQPMSDVHVNQPRRVEQCAHSFQILGEMQVEVAGGGEHDGGNELLLVGNRERAHARHPVQVLCS